MSYKLLLRATYILLGPDIEVHTVELQYSDTAPYNRFRCSKNDIAETHRHK